MVINWTQKKKKAFDLMFKIGRELAVSILPKTFSYNCIEILSSEMQWHWVMDSWHKTFGSRTWPSRRRVKLWRFSLQPIDL